MDKLVSIISPCYNGEQYIDKFLEAVLRQTYEHIQLIVVDDGSTDKTLEILEKYKDRFADRNIEYIILTKENGGQASAVNVGLRHVTGEYVTWPDSDDFLYEKSIEKRVAFLEQNREYDMVLSNGDEYDILSLEKMRSNVVSEKQAEKLLDCVLDMTAMFNNNGYLVRTQKLWQVYPEKRIHESRAGQNIQLLLPLASVCKCGFIDEPLYGRTIRKDSHSKMQTDFQLRRNQLDDVYFHTIAEMTEKQAYCAVRYGLCDLYSQVLTREKDSLKNMAKLCFVSVGYLVKSVIKRIISLLRKEKNVK